METHGDIFKMSSLNQCNFIGRIGKDPETRYMSNGDAVTNITLAVDESYKNKSGDRVDKVEWVNIVFYRKLSEIAGKYLKKGGLIFISGKQETRKYTDKNGIERYTTQIIANEMKMLGGKPESISQQQQESRTQNKANVSGFEDSDIDDIPFN